MSKTKNNSKRKLLIGDIAGWVGSFLVLLAYFLASAGVVSGQSYTYQILNALGAIGLITLGVVRRAIPSAVLNVVWLVVGVVAIISLLTV